ncbi:amidase [Lipingzhangella sp. LS1_29]|uniref:Amidase n=1 Tax=Lipingzhangella rawalii TaxID=2055835 RepID=A0ABU2H269_9ACTN|nr:amidase [Lipingzhangella rawalii]MDS1268910.1 amidase [Lipingzhangella rawalii]
MDAAELTLTQAHRAIARAEVSPVELLDAVCTRVAALDSHLNATVAVFHDAARSCARAAEREIVRNGPRGPLHGIPISVKEIVDLAGVPTLAGSASRAAHPDAHVPARDAVAVRRLREAGAIVFATSRSHELAYGVTTPRTHNPWRYDRSPGGSSGGAAALVAARCGPVALGTDTAGSVRIPASVCGTVGLKPTPGLVPRTGIVPLSETLDTPGPLGRTVDDTAAVLAVLTGMDLNPGLPDATRLPNGLNLSEVRIGVPTTYFFDGCDPEIAAATHRTIAALDELGAQTREVALPYGQELATAGGIVVGAEAGAEHGGLLEEDPDSLTDEVRSKLAVGRDISAVDYLDAQRTLRSVSRRWDAVLRDIDVLVTPTLAATARPFGAASTDPGQDPRIRHTRLTQPANLTGRPAITIPCGLDTADIPMGVQLIGRAHEENTLLAVARAVEMTVAWSDRVPLAADTAQ